MAALDFGMALARGMLPTSEKAQKDLMNLAGGRNVFKSEDWWNQQVDKQISEGYRTVATRQRILDAIRRIPARTKTSQYNLWSYNVWTVFSRIRTIWYAISTILSSNIWTWWWCTS